MESLAPADDSLEHELTLDDEFAELDGLTFGAWVGSLLVGEQDPFGGGSK